MERHYPLYTKIPLPRGGNRGHSQITAQIRVEEKRGTSGTTYNEGDILVFKSGERLTLFIRLTGLYL